MRICQLIRIDLVVSVGSIQLKKKSKSKEIKTNLKHSVQRNACVTDINLATSDIEK